MSEAKALANWEESIYIAAIDAYSVLMAATGHRKSLNTKKRATRWWPIF
jgi:hypothetical protein